MIGKAASTPAFRACMWRAIILRFPLCSVYAARRCHKLTVTCDGPILPCLTQENSTSATELSSLTYQRCGKIRTTACRPRASNL